MIKKWGDFIREFVDEPINVDYINSRMHELKDTVMQTQNDQYNDDDFYLGLEWSIEGKSHDNNSQGQLNINFSTVDGDIRFEFDLDRLEINKIENESSISNNIKSMKISSVEEGLDIIEKYIYNYLGVSESVVNEWIDIQTNTPIADALLVTYLLLFMKWRDLTIENLVNNTKKIVIDFAKFLNGYGYPIDVDVLENRFDKIVKMVTIKAKSDRLRESFVGKFDYKDLIGKKVRIVRLEDPYTHLKPGDEGTVRGVDDAGHIMMKWDSGSTLNIIPEIDEFDVID